MARPIATIPELEGKEAEEFVRKANENLKRKGTDVISVSEADIREMEERSRKFMEEFFAFKKKKDVVS